MLHYNVPLVFMITIIDRGHDAKIIKLFTDAGVIFNLLTFGEGTANSKVLNYLGLGDRERTLLFSSMPLNVSKGLLKKLSNEIKLHKPGNGIAFTVPISSICGTGAAKCLHGLPKNEDGEGENMGQVFDHDLIIAVSNRGFADEVMEAAKSAKATGGTVIHGRGTARGAALREAEKFFGVTVQPEKDLILILTPREFKRGIMEAIVTKTGVQTDAKTIVFSLPVNGIAGFTNLQDKE